MQIDQATGTLTAVDDLHYQVSEGVVMLRDPNSAWAEAVGALRSHIIAQHLPEGRRSLAICSPTPGAGCTSLAVNLAVALAEAEIKVLLIDADLRAPAIDGFIIPSQPPIGLREVLGEQGARIGDAIHAEVLPNLSIMYAGAGTERPQELLATNRFKDLVELCLRDFDVTIIDTPAASISADARRIASVAGYAMMVVGRDRTYVHDVKVFAGELHDDQVKVIGSVLNQP